MSQVPFPDPAPGHNGAQPPLPGAGARDGQPGGAGPVPDGASPDAGMARDGQAGAGTVRDDAARTGQSGAGSACEDAMRGGLSGGAGLAGDDTARGAGVWRGADVAWEPEADAGFDYDADLARFVEDIDAGRIAVPPEDAGAPAVQFTLGEAADADPAELGRMAGPDGLGGDGFGQHKVADALRPGPLLSALTEQAAGDVTAVSDNELLGMVQAARRLQNRAGYLELAGIAEFTRRHAARYAASVAAGARPGRRDGEFPDSVLGVELLISDRAAGDRMDLATDLATRLPCTFAGMADGSIDGGKAAAIAAHTRFLSDAGAAHADKILAAAAPGLRYDSVVRKAAALEMKLDPEGYKRRKEAARRVGRRVEARREASGNMSYGGRELAVEEALAAKASIDADAAALRAAGMPGRLQDLRVLAYLDRLEGRDPLDRLVALHAGGGAGDSAGSQDGEFDPGDDADTDDGEDEDEDEDAGYDGEDPDAEYGEDGKDGEDPDGEGGPGGGSSGGPRGPKASPPGSPPGRPAPLPALINLIVPAGTLLGWSTAPGDAGGWGLLDGDDTRTIVQAASQHPRTRWCVTVTGDDGTAVQHGCARGRHPWTPPGTSPPGTTPNPSPPDGTGGSGGSDGTGGGRDGPGRPRDGTTPPPVPDEHQQAQLAALLRALNITFAPIARGSCDHKHREDRYTPSRKLKCLVRARTTRCDAPGCGAQAVHCDLDHTRPWPEGITCECELGPKCRRHHRVKQAPGWHLEQPEPGIMRWTTPSGRTHTTRPTVYEV